MLHSKNNNFVNKSELIGSLVVYTTKSRKLFKINFKPNKAPASYFGRTPGRFLWCCLVLVVFSHHREFFICELLFHVTGTLPWLLRALKAFISSELYPDAGCFCFVFAMSFLQFCFVTFWFVC